MATTVQSESGITFPVNDVEPAGKPCSTMPLHEALKGMLGSGVESCSNYHQQVLSGHHYQPLLAAVYTAYSLHYPLVLSPDAVWITITQGIAHHMAVEGERLRDRFVDHQGKLTLTFQSQDWVKGTPENPWPEAFESWATQIREHVGDKLYQSLVTDFSTTGPVERTVSHIVMMDIFQRFFKYRMVGICGLPSVTLLGTADDWRNLRDKVDGLKVFDIDWWLSDLKSICDQFARASNGDIDEAHWKNICKLKESYGGDIINGWVARLFPYLRCQPDGPCTRRNPIFETGAGFQTYSAPSGLSRVPMTWEDAAGNVRQMEVVGGLAGVTQNAESLSLEPVAGWAVREASQIEQLMLRLRTEQTTFPREPKSVSIDENEKRGRRLRSDSYPGDFARLYHELSHASITGKNGHRIEMCSFRDVTSFDWGEDESDGSRGPDGHTWYQFADLDDGRQLAINLDVNRHRPDQIKFDYAYDEFHPICVTSESSVGVEGENPVIAWNFREWLEKSLNWAAIQNDEAYYWDSEEFNAPGDAQDWIRGANFWDDAPKRISIAHKIVASDWASRGFSCELWTDPPGQQWENFTHATDELVTVLLGRVEFEVEGETHELKAGDELLIPAGNVHSARNVCEITSQWLFGYRQN